MTLPALPYLIGAAVLLLALLTVLTVRVVLPAVRRRSTSPTAGGDGLGPAGASVVRRPRRWLVAVSALSVLLVVSLAATTVAVVALQRQENRVEERAGALRSARQLALDFTTYKYGSWDADAQRVLRDTTGQFRDEFQAGATSVKTEVVANRASSTGEVLEAAVVSNDTDSAQVLVIVNAVVTNTAATDGVERRYRIKLDLVRDGDRWLTADLQVVG